MHRINRRMMLRLVPICWVAVHLAGSSAWGERAPIRNRKDLREALAAAKTGDDHLRLARYYQRKAEALRAKAEREDQLVQYHRHHPLTTKYPTPADRSRQLADYYRGEWKKAISRAARHQRLAAEPGRSTPN